MIVWEMGFVGRSQLKITIKTHKAQTILSKAKIFIDPFTTLLKYIINSFININNFNEIRMSV